MSNFKIGGKIATNGLILHLDADNYQSYPGSGNIWYDLTKFKSNGTIDEALFVPDTPSYIHINNNNVGGNNLGVNFQVPITSDTVTVDMWVKMTQGWGIWILFSWNSYFFGFFPPPFAPADSQFGWGIGGGDFRYLVNSTLGGGNPGFFSNWTNITIVMKINTSYINNKGYLNGILYNQGGSNITPTSFNSGQGRIGTWDVNNFYYSTFYCNLVRIYNRELTQAEISQNFNAMKSRFGIF